MKITPTVAVAATAAASLGVGFVAGALFMKKKLGAEFDARMESELAQAKEFYGALHKRGDFSTPESATEALGIVDEAEKLLVKASEAMQNYNYNAVSTVGKPQKAPEEVSEEEAEVEVEVQERNIFVDSQPLKDDYFDYEEQEKLKEQGKPYIITEEEFMRGDLDYVQSTLTYFFGDDMLVDSKDDPIVDADDLVGNDNLTKFGHGSKDKNIVYIRNEAEEVDFEVVKSERKYTEEVLGIIEHSDRRPGIKRFRGDDE